MEFKATKYSKAPKAFTVPNSETKQWICKTYDHGLKQRKLPAQAKPNKLELEDIPSELLDLNLLKVCLICQGYIYCL